MFIIENLICAERVLVWASCELYDRHRVSGRGRDWWGESRMRLRRGDLITIRTIRLCSPHLSPVNIISHAPSLVSSCPSLHLIMNFSWKFWKEDWSLWSWWLISMKKTGQDILVPSPSSPHSVTRPPPVAPLPGWPIDSVGNFGASEVTWSTLSYEERNGDVFLKDLNLSRGISLHKLVESFWSMKESSLKWPIMSA